MSLVDTLTQRAVSYRFGGPSSEHTAKLLDEAAARIEELEEIINDLVQNESERSVMGVYPGRAEVFRKAWDRAAEAVGLDDGGEA